MQPPEHPGRIRVGSNDHLLVANVGLLVLITLVHRLHLGGLVGRQVDQGWRPGSGECG